MSITANDVISRARKMITDDQSPDLMAPRNSDTDMFTYLNDAMEDAVDRRPYLLLSDVDTLATLVDVTALGDTLIFETSSREPLAHYVAHRVFGLDASDEHNASMSRMHLQLYVEQI